MSKKPNAAAFLAAMQGGQPEQDEPPARVTAAPAAAPAAAPQDPATAEIATLKPVQARAPRAKAKPGRAQLKHFGGYLDDETLEKIALLRVRLKKDNSELIKFAIDELHRKHNAKRAFGDA
ncbi:MAG: hypothetical protein M0Z28_29085 [Rhodospirillales bacterium]|nr:hypothetical protein [Rhodospirillales bacterium]